MHNKRSNDKRLAVLDAAINAASDALLVIDCEGRVVEWNSRAATFFGWSREEAINQYLHLMIVPERFRDRHQQGLKQFSDQRSGKLIGQRLRLQAMRRNGEEFAIELTVNPFELDGEFYLFACIRDNFAELVENSLEQQVALLNLSRDGIVVCNLDLRLIFWNQGAERLYGFEREEVQDKPVFEVLRSIYPVPLEEIKKALLKERYWEGEITNHHKNGQAIIVLSRWTLEVDTLGEPTRILISSTDITESRNYQQRMLFLATHDVLTKLPNRAFLEDELKVILSEGTTHGHTVAVMFMDLNRFKIINDSLGHLQGDRLLTVVAQRLSNTIREGDIVARLGGDEFVVVLDRINRFDDIEEVADRILNTVSQPLMLGGQEVVVSTSIGISVFPNDGEDYSSLVRAADIAMYQAKRAGKGAFRFYSQELNSRVFHRLFTENALRSAIGRDQLVVHYQPRVCGRSNKILSVEALVRWEHPEKGMIFPNEFISIAEEIDLIDAIGEWVLRRACSQLQQWQEMALARFTVSVNLSPRQLGSSGIEHLVARILSETHLDPGCLELEVTESGLMENIDSVYQTLNAIRNTGVQISIDDFGTGYSSLNHLKRLPIDAIKIDCSFIRDLISDSDDAAIVTAMLAMGKTMGMKVIAEGVMTRQQVDFLVTKGCDELQGFYFCPPVSAGDLEAAITAGRFVS